MSRSLKEARDAPYGRVTDPPIGPADPETRRRLLQQAEAEGGKRTPAPPAETPAPPPPDTRGGRERAIDNFVDEANRGKK